MSDPSTAQTPHPHFHPITQSLDRAMEWHRDLRTTIHRLDGAFHQWQVSPKLAVPWRNFVDSLDDHIRVEEELLFPGLRALAMGQAPQGAGFETALEEMRHEIDEVGRIIAPLRAVAAEAGELEPDLLDVLEQLEAHAEREQNLIHPEGVRLLTIWRETKAAPHPEAAPEHEDGVLFRVLRRLARLGAGA